jgi:hypothetical protein
MYWYYRFIIILFIIIFITGVILSVIFIPKKIANINWSYNKNNLVYKIGVPIEPLIPNYNNFIYGIFPIETNFPLGLNVDMKTGIITGTPTQVSPNTSYVILGEGKNLSGKTILYIEVTL